MNFIILDKMTYQKIIISRTDSIGDVILTLPLAGYLKQCFPQTKIVFFGKSYTKAVVDACKYVDEIIVYHTEEDLLNIFKTQHIDIRFLGDEYKTKDFTAKQWCLDHGIELHYHKRQHQYSSSDLRNRVYQLELTKQQDSSTINIQQHSPDILNKYKDNQL